MPYLYYITAGAIVIGVLLLIKLGSKPKKCEVCGSSSHDKYDTGYHKRTPLCREHLVSRWKQDMAMFRKNTVMIEPDFEKLPLAYLHFGANELTGYEYPQEAVDKVISILATISGKQCSGCSKSATVAFFRKQSFEWPFFERLSGIPDTHLCISCAVNKVAPLIMHASRPFTEAIYKPREVEGIYHAQEW